VRFFFRRVFAIVAFSSFSTLFEPFFFRPGGRFVGTTKQQRRKESVDERVKSGLIDDDEMMVESFLSVDKGGG